MVTTCVVYGCHNRSSKGSQLRFFRIPVVRKNEGEAAWELSQRRRALWLARINRKNFQPSESSRVCSDHFVQGRPSYLHDSKNPDWAPSLKLGYIRYACRKTGREESDSVSSRRQPAKVRRASVRIIQDDESFAAEALLFLAAARPAQNLELTGNTAADHEAELRRSSNSATVHTINCD
ncbi:hypothetical protein GJAV_G00122490 [Gymnothorax javanicus]|nr:hypothetical protein GJAV_G00122490 [Gymnothorax javanicus]